MKMAMLRPRQRPRERERRLQRGLWDRHSTHSTASDQRRRPGKAGAASFVPSAVWQRDTQHGRVGPFVAQQTNMRRARNGATNAKALDDTSRPFVGAPIELIHALEIERPWCESFNRSCRFIAALAIRGFPHRQGCIERSDVAGRAGCKALFELHRARDSAQCEGGCPLASGRTREDRERRRDGTGSVRVHQDALPLELGRLVAHEREEVHVQGGGIAVAHLTRGGVRGRALGLKVGLRDCSEALLHIAVVDRLSCRLSSPWLRRSTEACRVRVIHKVAKD
mmetsp:Transcript_27227/g.82669  ORF Transcript_27227/g.82669 Transcript_27227/m.82669 type:complete len:281 (+) Transcript_27227:37-879(+)|eukprot:scaffold255466_cov29-Tisochrysis_lutea.AAC.2